ncbi:MAG: threonyl-tRNA synthetase, partial [Actinomycetota bacterium]|nr:threonyl-tRNA synthetase [Actinomycetota bacterium]
MSEPSSVLTVPADGAGRTAGELLRDAGVKDTAVARVNGELRDLAHIVAEGDAVEAVPYGSEDGRAVLRHSAAHVLAQAVQELFPGTLLGIGPPIKDGFYYDFLPERPFTPEDLAAIEKKMSDITRQRQRFSRRVVSEDDARKELEHEKFKLELIGLKGSGDSGEDVEVGGTELTIYDNLVGEETVWKDLCRGPHLPTTRDIPAYKIMRSAAAYWRGDQANEQLQRIYGTAWESKDALKEHLHLLEEAEKRDHRKLGA